MNVIQHPSQSLRRHASAQRLARTGKLQPGMAARISRAVQWQTGFGSRQPKTASLQRNTSPVGSWAKPASYAFSPTHSPMVVWALRGQKTDPRRRNSTYRRSERHSTHSVASLRGGFSAWRGGLQASSDHQGESRREPKRGCQHLQSPSRRMPTPVADRVMRCDRRPGAWWKADQACVIVI